MLEKDIHLLEELDSVSQIHFLDRNDIDHIMTDLAIRILPSLRIERMSVWLFNSEKTALISIGEYDTRTEKFNKNSVLHQNAIPIYFEALRKNKIIIAEDIYNHPATMELNEEYSKPNSICSLMDIPLRISGELIGVICFEKVDIKRVFTANEQSFCLSLSFVLASTLESRQRRVAQAKLEALLTEKETLVKEINHRVKNNFSILISLIRISKNKARTEESRTILQEYEQRLFSMLKIHDLLNQSYNHSEINLSKYITELVNEFRVSFPHFNHCVNTRINNYEFTLSSKRVLYLGLIVTEILLNSIKHAAANTPNYELTIELLEINDHHVNLTIGDNGPGFDFEKEVSKDSLGLPLIKDLSSAIDVDAKFPTLKNSNYTFFFKL
ncbi:MAG: histidine kinase dimerization/phosphoacceptor domain -containing protein [Bacteroidota bacterium]|nr:histidine kinase dimerization/phosphoacceptor domain -containing protein [Bacteroidota bacterium]